MNLDFSRLAPPANCPPLRLGGDVPLGSNGRRHPMVRGIPRAVASDNHARAGGDRWNLFPRAHLDSRSSLPLFENRLDRCMCGRMLHAAHDAIMDVSEHRRTPGSAHRTPARLGATSIIVTMGGKGMEAYCEKPTMADQS